MWNEYQAVLRRARTDLADAKMQRDSLNMTIDRLEAFIAHAEVLAGPTAPLFEQSNAPTPAIQETTEATSEPIWKALVTALNGKKAKFTVPEGLAALDRIGRKINGKNRGTIVRNAIKDKPNVFGKHSEGFYFVRGYETTQTIEPTEENESIENRAIHYRQM